MPKAKVKVLQDKIEVETLPVVNFREGDAFVAYSPPLDLSACGDSFEEASRNLEEAAQILFTECLERGTLGQVLIACGWTVDDSANRRKASPPVYIGQGRISVKVPEFA